MQKNTQALSNTVTISTIENEEKKTTSILSASNFLAELIREEMVKEAKEDKEAA